MKAFLRSSVVISPQDSFATGGFPEKWINYSGTLRLSAIEPPYREFLDPMASRRMSRVVKMAVCGALKCLRNAGMEAPDGIVMGTSLGCLEDTEKFLTSVYTNEEHLLNPTPFIQSTHNTVAGAIAMAVKCHGYNSTYTHRGISFESALMDALMQLEENPASTFLVGSFDELTATSFAITKRLGLWKNKPINSLNLMNEKGRGSLPGEGLAFFTMGGVKSDLDIAVLSSLHTVFQPGDASHMEDEITGFLSRMQISPDDVDLVMLGVNGDSRTDFFYRHLMSGLFRKTPQAGFKHLCGEYDTAASFALWMAAEILRTQQLPGEVLLGTNKPRKLSNILIYNNLNGINHSLYWLSAC